MQNKIDKLLKKKVSATKKTESEIEPAMVKLEEQIKKALS